MKKSFLKGVAVCCVAAACALTLAACGGSGSSTKSGPVAATVNGEKIYESEVTEYIQNYRASYNMEDEDSWGQWMANYGYEPSTVREAIIHSFISEKLVEMACNEMNVDVDDETVNNYVNQIKQYYETDEEWQNALKEAGLTEEEYRSNIKSSLRSETLQEKVAADAAVSDEDIVEGLKTYVPYFDGTKRSSHILFNASDTELAQQVLDQIKAGADFGELAKQYSKDGSSANGGDVGYDTGSFVEPYTTALDKLEVGQVSDLVTSEFGIHIIKCTDEFKAPETIESADGIPEAFVTEIKQYLTDNAQSEAYSTWMEEYEGKADIVINDMPSKLPYDLDMSKYEAQDVEDEDGEIAAVDGEDGEVIEVEGEDGEEAEEIEGDGDEEAIELLEDEGGLYYVDEDGEKVYLDLDDGEDDEEGVEEAE